MSVASELHRLRGRRKEAATSPGAARRLLTNPTATAVALFTAAQGVLGDFFTWEPESAWLELERSGLDIPPVNQVKLQAALSLLFVPSFFWDAVVFEKTALAFDHVETNPEVLEEATSAQLAWAVKEAAWVRALHGNADLTFEHEPGAYAAVCLHREGLLEAPVQLAFCQAQLDRLNEGEEGLHDRVKTAWKALDKDTMHVHAFDETPVDVQLARLAAVELHVRDREARAAADLATLA